MYKNANEINLYDDYNDLANLNKYKSELIYYSKRKGFKSALSLDKYKIKDLCYYENRAKNLNTIVPYSHKLTTTKYTLGETSITNFESIRHNAETLSNSKEKILFQKKNNLYAKKINQVQSNKSPNNSSEIFKKIIKIPNKNSNIILNSVENQKNLTNRKTYFFKNVSYYPKNNNNLQKDSKNGILKNKPELNSHLVNISSKVAIILIKKIIQLNFFRIYSYFIRQIIFNEKKNNDNNKIKINKFINLVNKQFKIIVFEKIKKIDLNKGNSNNSNADKKDLEYSNLNCLNASNYSYDYSSHGTKQVIDLLNSINNRNNNDINFNDFSENKELMDNTPLITDNISLTSYINYTPSNKNNRKLRFIVKNKEKRKLFNKIRNNTYEMQIYLIKIIFLKKWFNKAIILKKRSIRNNKKFYLLKKHLFICVIEKIKNEGKRRVLIKFFINIKKMKYTSIRYSIRKIKKYVYVKSQIMEICASIIQRNYRLHIENSIKHVK